MTNRSLNNDDPLDDFARREITLGDVTKIVHGPAVVVMAKMPGISPHVARFSRWVRDAGFTMRRNDRPAESRLGNGLLAAMLLRRSGAKADHRQQGVLVAILGSPSSPTANFGLRL
jgi:hypothetical protein